MNDVINEIYSKYVNIRFNGIESRTQKNFDFEISDKVYEPNELLNFIEIKKSQLKSQHKKYVYGEISKLGVQTLYSEIIKENPDMSTFIDVGSGTGKLCLHMSLISEFENVVGVEILEDRYLYSIDLINRIGHDFDNVLFLNEDINNIDFITPCVVFADDVCFPLSVSEYIWNSIPKGSHFISYKLIDDPIKKINLSTTWSNSCNFNYYIKK